MINGRLLRAENHSCLVPEVRKTGTVFERMKGLLGTPEPTAEQGLLISPCSSVHTLGMSYRLDLVWLDRHLQVIKIVENLAPWRMASCARASMVLELKAGTIKLLNLSPGMNLEWQNIP